MLNRFKNALYGTSNNLSNIHDDQASSSSSSQANDREAVISKRIRSALTRSSSFREDLLNQHGNTFRSINAGNSGSGSNSGNNNSSSSNHNLDKDGYINDDHPKSRHQPYSYYNKKSLKFRYSRPEFLQLKTDDEILVSADHQIRPIILPRDVSRLAWRSGYAECINAGKSLRNEDQAVFHQEVTVRKISSSPPSPSETPTNSPTKKQQQDQQSQIQYNNRTSEELSITSQLPWVYFGIFDGHAGAAVAVAAAAQLHKIIASKLEGVSDLLIALEFDIGVIKDEDSDEYTDCAEVEKSSPPAGANSTASLDVTKPDTDTIEAAVTADVCPNEDEAPGNSLPTPVDGPNEPENSKDSSELPENDHVSLGDLVTDSKKPNSLDNADSESQGQGEKQTTTTPKVTEEDSEAKVAKMAIEIQSDWPPARGNFRNSAFDVCDPERALPSMLDICRNNITVETLITGALESAFWDMDALIAQDKCDFKMPGGCTAIVSLFILGKLYVCNAGDSRAIVYKNDEVIPMSFDFTPTSERERILRLGQQRPELLGTDFTHLEFMKRPTRKDLGKQMLYRDAFMTGWSMKTITYEDLRFPLVWGEGKRSRVLATIGVTRGFGDHELTAQHGSVLIKPFLTPEPEVKVLPLASDNSLTPEDVLIMGSDGLWDVTSNEKAAKIVKNSFDLFPESEESRAKYRYITAAQDLVIHSRGNTTWNNVWRKSNNKLASLDDIAVFVIPLKPYKDEYLEWKKLRSQASRDINKQEVQATFDELIDEAVE